MTSNLEEYYRDHLDFAYTCVDRIYIKGYVPILQSCAGFRYFAEQLRPEEPVTQSWIRSLTRRFHNNVKKYSIEHGIPLVEAQRGQRKHLIADEYREKFQGDQGVYLIVSGFESANTFQSEEPRHATASKHRNLSRRKGFVTHYSFYILDEHWGPMSVVICSHPPFNVKVILNSHHWIERQATAAGHRFEKQTNAFMDFDAPEKLQLIADSLKERDIRRVADRWTYRVLPLFSYKERHDIRFHYQWSIAQMEMCHNLVFRPAYPVAELFQRHIDLNRRFLSPKSIATVFGKKKQTRLEETSASIYHSYESRTILKIQHYSSILKQYDKHQRILRTECVSNDSTRFGVRKLLTNFHQLRAEMTATLQRFQDLQKGVVDSTLDRGELAALAQTSEFGNSRVPGIRLDNERIMTVLRLLGRIATDPRGFNSSQLRELYSAETGLPYSSSQASYDLRKLRAKQLLVQVPKTRRYHFTPRGARLAALLYKLRVLLIAPTLSSANVDIDGPCDDTHKSPGPKPESVPTDGLRTLLSKYAGNVSAVARAMNRQPCVIRRWIRRDQITLDEYRTPVLRPDIEMLYQDISNSITRLTEALELKDAS